MQKNIDKIENVIDTYQSGKFTMIISHDPEAESFHEGLKKYLKSVLIKEFGE
jgi:hypothetical protein